MVKIRPAHRPKGFFWKTHQLGPACYLDSYCISMYIPLCSHASESLMVKFTFLLQFVSKDRGFQITKPNSSAQNLVSSHTDSFIGISSSQTYWLVYVGIIPFIYIICQYNPIYIYKYIFYIIIHQQGIPPNSFSSGEQIPALINQPGRPGILRTTNIWQISRIPEVIILQWSSC